MVLYNKAMKSVSVVMATYNSMRTIEDCLQSLSRQKFPKSKIELIAADGGSTDGTIDVLKKFGADIIDERTGSPESAKAIALKKADNELVLFLASDNVIPHETWLAMMVEVLSIELEAVAAYPWKYTYDEKGTALNRYFALMGANDPLAWFMKKADRQGFFGEKWELSGKSVDKGNYFLVKFDENSLPTVGDNGFLVRKKIYDKARVDENNYFHIDVCVDLLRLDYDKYVVVKNEIKHDTGDQLVSFFGKRYRYMRDLYLESLNKRRYHIVDLKRDRGRVLVFGLYSLTLVGPLIWSLLGMRKKWDMAWLLHPVMCWGLTVVYGWGMLSLKARRLFS